MSQAVPAGRVGICLLRWAINQSVVLASASTSSRLRIRLSLAIFPLDRGAVQWLRWPGGSGSSRNGSVGAIPPRLACERAGSRGSVAGVWVTCARPGPCVCPRRVRTRLRLLLLPWPSCPLDPGWELQGMGQATRRGGKLPGTACGLLGAEWVLPRWGWGISPPWSDSERSCAPQPGSANPGAGGWDLL